MSGAGHKFSLTLVINVEPNMYVSGLAPFYGSEVCTLRSILIAFFSYLINGVEDLF